MGIGFIDTDGLHNCYDEDDNDWYYWSSENTATLTINTMTVNDKDQPGWSITGCVLATLVRLTTSMNLLEEL